MIYLPGCHQWWITIVRDRLWRILREKSISLPGPARMHSKRRTIPKSRRWRAGSGVAAVTDGLAGRIFISYRRADTPHVAGRLFDRLQTYFGADNVFMDVDSIEPGVDFAESIENAVGACDVLLALIGPHWADAVDELGRRRLEDPDDFVTLEISAALRRRIRVIPVLVDGASPPRREELPEGLSTLARRQGVRLDHSSFGASAAALVIALERAINARASVVDTKVKTGGTLPRPGVVSTVDRADVDVAAEADIGETSVPRESSRRGAIDDAAEVGGTGDIDSSGPQYGDSVLTEEGCRERGARERADQARILQERQDRILRERLERITKKPTKRAVWNPFKRG